MALPLVYSDGALLVLDKPSGLLSVPGRGEDRQDCMSRRAQQQFAQAQIVHRLDMGTSGLLLMALGLDVQRVLQRQFALRQVQSFPRCVLLLPVRRNFAECYLNKF